MNFSEFLQPAIFGLTGKPGAGKSYFATRVIIAEIMEGKNRPIVSNVPINKEKLRQYTGKDFYYYPLETYTDNKAFFSNRGYYNLEVDDLGANVDFAPLLKEDDEGVLFIIDEAHLYFNARNWKHMPQATLSYITTIRHVGDSLIWMCQKFSDIDSQIRGKTQAFHLLRNLEKEKLGMFKRGTGFRCYQYQEEHHISTHGSGTNPPSQDFAYPFDIKVAECYNTSLFNKSHDKKYRIKAIPLNYIIYACITIAIFAIYWVADGGYRKMFSAFLPEMAKIEKSEQSTQVNLQTIQPVTIPELPASDPFNKPIEDPGNIYNEHAMMFNSSEDQTTDKLLNTHDKEHYKALKKQWFGENRKCKLTFISDKVTKENDFDFSFGYYWQHFNKVTSASLATEVGIWQLKSNVFQSFITWVKDTGKGANMKETDMILKENVSFDLVHGYQLPYQDSFATQGVVRSTQQYKDVGFTLELLFQDINGSELLQVVVENTDVMDITSDKPVLQSFRSSNVLDVEKGYTYQIADFRSVTSQVSKGLFKKSDYSTEITNKIFLSYGLD